MNISTTPTTVTNKGQVTIPVAIREYLSVKPHDKVRFEVTEDGSVRVTPAPSRLAALFESVKPTTMHKDDETLRQAFEEGVAEAVLSRDTK
jgi:AbrB family looped-hinge helix DNA binding protein